MNRAFSVGLFTIALCSNSFSQDSAAAAAPAAPVAAETAIQSPAPTTANPAAFQPKIAKYDYDAMPKDPLASAFFSATIPGTGQIYNKEYLSGICTAVLFYGGFFGAQYMVSRWQQLNTDTIYFREYTQQGTPLPLDTVRAVFVPRADEDQVGLPTGEKVILGACVVAAAASYVWGIFDSYNGAKRYNKRLMALAPGQTKFACTLGPQGSVGLIAQIGF